MQEILTAKFMILKMEDVGTRESIISPILGTQEIPERSRKVIE